MLQIGIGQRIRYLRIAKGLEQKDLAQELGVSPNTVSTWETGQRLIPVDKFGRLASFFNVGWNFLGEADESGLPEWLKEPVKEAEKAGDFSPKRARRRH